MLLSIPHLLTPEDVSNARQLLSNADWSDGRRTAGFQAREVKNNEQLPGDHATAQAIGHMVLKALERNALFLTAALPRKIFPPTINRYSGAANHYGRHIDSAIRTLPHNGQRLRTDMSCTVFLSPPEDYEGGELVLSDTYGEQRVKLPAGHAVLYPGTSLHQVTPVTQGSRLACFFWVESLVRSDEQRRLLFDMDMALMQLRRDHGENEATIALTGTYHNLLRMWSDT